LEAGAVLDGMWVYFTSRRGRSFVTDCSLVVSTQCLVTQRASGLPRRGRDVEEVSMLASLQWLAQDMAQQG
jgi:hypothetical protein